jgi:hypothetical protein
MYKHKNLIYRKNFFSSVSFHDTAKQGFWKPFRECLLKDFLNNFHCDWNLGKAAVGQGKQFSYVSWVYRFHGYMGFTNKKFLNICVIWQVAFFIFTVNSLWWFYRVFLWSSLTVSLNTVILVYVICLQEKSLLITQR